MINEINHSGPAGALSRRTRHDWLPFFAVILLASGARIFFFQGIYAIDDFNYLRHAAEVWKGVYNLAGVLYWHGMRPMVFVPAAAMFKVFGVSEASAVACSIIYSLLAVGLVYRVGVEMFGREAGFYAGVAAALLPSLVEESSRVAPGSAINFLLAASLLFFIRAEKRELKAWLQLFISGFLFASVQLAGPIGFLFGFFFLSAVLILRSKKTLSYWPFAAGFTVFAILFSIYQWKEAGTPAAAAVLTRNILAAEPEPFRPFFYFKLMFRPPCAQAGIFYLAVAGSVVAVKEKSKAALVPAAAVAAMWLALEFGSSSIIRYQPLFKQGRYLSTLSLPAVLLAGYVICWARRQVCALGESGKTKRPGTAAALSVLLLMGATSIVCLNKRQNWTSARVREIHEVRDIVQKYKGRTIYVTHWLWNTRVGFFMKYDREYFPSGYDPYHAVRLEAMNRESMNKYVQALNAGDSLAPGLLINDESMLDASRKSHSSYMVGKNEIPAVMDSIPHQWRFAGRINVGSYGTAALYEIPGGRWPGGRP